MSSKRKVILTCAVTGENSFNRKFPNYPISPQQIAAAAFEAQEAGASAVHLHVRDPQAGDGSREPSMSKVRMEIEGRSMRRGPKLEPIVFEHGGARAIDRMDALAPIVRRRQPKGHAQFFWASMMSSARSSLRRSRALLRDER
jgi:hypothetical protein